ncbi:MAG: alpha/beta hydrolase [Gammaproteobacteria bacterium]|nr:MAG: alpha/beta hydrolase [Gammaproteobacteria bacterium]
MCDKKTSLTFQLPDGRQLGYAQYGADNGDPFFYFHGLPGSRYESRLLEASYKALNVCLYAVDRPGYGLSGFVKNRSLAHWPNDIAMLADALGIETFGIIGISGGGPYVLACAHEIPERISSMGIVCGLGPVYESALRREMHWVARSGFYFARQSPASLRDLYGKPLNWLANTHPALALRLLAYFNGGADKPVLLRSDILELLSASLQESFRQGPSAAIQDVVIYQNPWGFELSNIRKHIHLWHGNADRIVPCCHSEFVHSQLPDSVLDIVPNEGHFSLPVRHAEAILTTLVGAESIRC